MIDTTEEALISFAQAAAELPRRRQGCRLHVSTLYRWASSGCRGVRLETIQVGGTRCTSRQALQRFFERLTQTIPDDAPPGPNGPRSPARRRRESEAAARQLEQLGA